MNYKKYIDKLKSINLNEEITYNRIFNNKGVYGLVGTCKLKKNNIIFKIGIDVNRNIIHENIILQQLNSLKEYCPHFVYCFGKKILNVNEDFIYEPYKYNLLTENINNTIPREIIYLEQLDKYPIYKFIKENTNKNLIFSQILQLLIALEISQKNCKLTHYDLHSGNILIQKCNVDTLFLYKINNISYCIPTYGFYPVIIDTGISFSSDLNGQQMCSNTDSYDYGFQSTLFDKLNDVHHFLLSLFYSLEIYNDEFDTLSNKIKKIFKHLPVLRKSGWKKLPFDISDIVIDKIKYIENYEDLILFREYKSDLLELLNGLIKLPLQDYGDGDLNCFYDFIIELQNILNYKEFIDKFSSNELLYCIKKIIDILYENTENIIDKIKLECSKYIVYTKEKTDGFIYVDETKIDWNLFIQSGNMLSHALSTNYYRLRSKHQDIIDMTYRKTHIKTPLDMFIYLSRNSTPHYNFESENNIEFWDIDNKKHLSLKIVLNPEQQNEINLLPFLEKSNKIMDYIR